MLSRIFWNGRSLIALVFCICGMPSVGHEVVVHEWITLYAHVSAEARSAGYSEFLELVGSIKLPIGPESKLPGLWLVEGSAREDDSDAFLDSGGKRSYNHLYDPLSGEGLSNFAPDLKIAQMGRDSFTWAAFLNSPGLNFRFAGFPAVENVNTYNAWSWQNARQFQWIGLTDASRSIREENLGKMFRALVS